jgi:hypothetical protein
MSKKHEPFPQKTLNPFFLSPYNAEVNKDKFRDVSGKTKQSGN